MHDSNLITQSHGIRFGAWFFSSALCLVVFGCVTTPKDSADTPNRGTYVDATASDAVKEEPDEGPTEFVEQRLEDGTLASTAEGWRDVDGNFVHHGAYTVYWENGKKKSEVYYKDGTRHGPRTSWHADGILWKLGRHENGRAVGRWEEWHAAGTKAREMTFINGGLNGWMTEWYGDGQMRHKVMYIKGLRQGRESRWDSDGALLYEADYLDDVMQP